MPISGTLLELCSAKSFSQVIEKPEHKKTKRAPGKEEQKVMYNVRNGLKYYTKFNWTMVNYGNSSCIVNIRLLNLIFLFKLKNCFKRSHRYWGVTVPVIYFQIPSNEVKFSYYPSQTAASSLLGDSESIPYLRQFKEADSSTWKNFGRSDNVVAMLILSCSSKNMRTGTCPWLILPSVKKPKMWTLTNSQSYSLSLLPPLG